jgi:tRNA(adenine34) deaminase
MNKEFMYRALKLAKTAAQQGDVPVGAVLVKNGEIIGEGLNRRENNGDPTAHAEIEAIRMGAKNLGSWHLDDCELYVTLEPCPMCAGAIINSRVKTVIFGAFEPKTGSCCNDSVINLFNLPYNHRPEVYGGICEKECAAVMTDFFKEKR